MLVAQLVGRLGRPAAKICWGFKRDRVFDRRLQTRWWRHNHRMGQFGSLG